MARIDIERSRKLLKSARTLYKAGDYHGVAGLAYQAFESAIVCLIEIKNGIDQKSHAGRRRRAKQILAGYSEKIDKLWTARNIGFYGNILVGKDKREISAEEVLESLNTVEEIIDDIVKFVEEK